MIRMSDMYPTTAGKKFDYDYDANKHMALVKQRMGAALLRCEVDKGMAGAVPGSPAPFTAIGHLYFNSVADLQGVMKPHGKELMADVPNFTDITPQVQISEVIA